MKIAILIFLVLFVAGLDSSRILVVYLTISQSHMIPLQTLSEVLAEKGHEVTFFSPFPLKKQVNNYRDIKISFNETLKEEFIGGSIGKSKLKAIFTMFPAMLKFMQGLSADTLKSDEMKRMMKEEKFDLFILGD